MKEKFKGIIIGLLLGVTLTGGSVIAKNTAEKITVYYRNIKVYKDKTPVALKDSNGQTVEPFIYNGTAYLPLKAAANAAGLSTTWDGNTNSIYIWDKVSSGSKFLLDVCPPYDKGSWSTFYSSKAESFEMADKKYSNGIAGFQKNPILFNLNGKYSSLECVIGHIADEKFEKTISFVIDGETIRTVRLLPYAMPEKVSIPLNHAMQLRITQSTATGHQSVGIGNITVK